MSLEVDAASARQSPCLTPEGADIGVVARTVEEIDQTGTGIEDLGQRALPLPTDVRRPDEVQRTVNRVLAEFGKIDILLSAAGSVRWRLLKDSPTKAGKA